MGILLRSFILSNTSSNTAYSKSADQSCACTRSVLGKAAKGLLAHGAVATGAMDSVWLGVVLDVLLKPFSFLARKSTEWVAETLD